MGVKLEHGKRYRARNGDVVTVVYDERLQPFPFSGDNGCTYTVDGRHVRYRETKRDLIEEVTEEGGWIKWEGGVCPVRAGQKVQLDLKYAGVVTTACPQNYIWHHDDENVDDIIAYRVISEGNEPAKFDDALARSNDAINALLHPVPEGIKSDGSTASEIEKLREDRMEKLNRDLANHSKRIFNSLAEDVATEHPIERVMRMAIEQATKGKGERHGGDVTPFLEQPWAHYAKMHGRGFLTGQAAKKLEEAASTREGQPFIDEALGAIVYLCMAVLKERGEV